MYISGFSVTVALNTVVVCVVLPTSLAIIVTAVVPVLSLAVGEQVITLSVRDIQLGAPLRA